MSRYEAYTQKDYEDALKSFETIGKETELLKTVGEFEKVLEYMGLEVKRALVILHKLTGMSTAEKMAAIRLIIAYSVKRGRIDSKRLAKTVGGDEVIKAIKLIKMSVDAKKGDKGGACEPGQLQAVFPEIAAFYKMMYGTPPGENDIFYRYPLAIQHGSGVIFAESKQMWVEWQMAWNKFTSSEQEESAVAAQADRVLSAWTQEERLAKNQWLQDRLEKMQKATKDKPYAKAVKM